MVKREIKIERMHVEDLRLDFGNPRTIAPAEMDELKASLKKFDDFGVIVINEKDQVIAGNQRIAAMRELGWKKTVLCKRLVGFSKTEQKVINIRANRSSGEFDGEILMQWIDDIKKADLDVNLTGFTEVQLEQFQDVALQEEIEAVYTRKIISPQYLPRGEKPKLSELRDLEKRDDLIKKIDASGLPEDEKLFLRDAAARHVRFDYETIADYYAHSGPEVQRLMEASALVIIDFKNAIEDGYVQLSEELKRIQADDEA